MGFSILPLSRVSNAYQSQSLIADRIKQTNFKSVQMQKDTVVISSQALEELKKAQKNVKMQEEHKVAAEIFSDPA